MYIPPFVCGVIATILAELIGTIIVAMVISTKPKKGGKK